ncbi:hypothetical protein AVP43_00695 [Geobacillus stearothermophilus]|nr:hypothetical protein AVP43_00695 [Geobacillus stearothermophilus]
MCLTTCAKQPLTKEQIAELFALYFLQGLSQ